MSKKDLEDILNWEKIGKKYGITHKDLEYIKRMSTGSFLFDWILGGGLPIGGIVEIFGTESSGKSTLVKAIVAYRCRIDPDFRAIIFNTEGVGSYEKEWVERIGVNLDQVQIISSDKEGILDMIVDFAASDDVDLIVVDTIAAVKPDIMEDRSTGDRTFSPLAGILSQNFFLRVKGRLEDNDTTLVLVNQMRENVGQMFGPELKTMGGRAIRHYSAIRLLIDNYVPKKDNPREYDPITDKLIRLKLNVTNIKNKTATPGRKGTLSIYAPLDTDEVGGFDLPLDLVTVGRNLDVIVKKDGSSFKESGGGNIHYVEHNGEMLKLDNGFAASVTALRGEEELRQIVFEKVVGKLNEI